MKKDFFLNIRECLPAVWRSIVSVCPSGQIARFAAQKTTTFYGKLSLERFKLSKRICLLALCRLDFCFMKNLSLFFLTLILRFLIEKQPRDDTCFNINIILVILFAGNQDFLVLVFPLLPPKFYVGLNPSRIRVKHTAMKRKIKVLTLYFIINIELSNLHIECL